MRRTNLHKAGRTSRVPVRSSPCGLARGHDAACSTLKVTGEYTIVRGLEGDNVDHSIAQTFGQTISRGVGTAEISRSYL